MMSEQLSWRGALAALLLVLTPVARAHAQIKEGFDDRATAEENAPKTHMDSLKQIHMIHVSPNALYFDERTHSGTVTLKNDGNKPVTGDVLVLFAYPDWPHGLPADTTIITPNMDILTPRDTVVALPGPKDRFAGKWLTGIPTRVTLPPHQAKQVTIQINPPAGIPNGEYWARVVVLVNPQNQGRGNGQDTRQKYALPIKGQLPALRDSVIVFYRQGAMKAGVTFGAATAARFDSVGYGGPDGRDCPHSLWIKLPLHLTGNTHVDGILTVTYKNVQTGDLVPVNRWEVSLYHDAVTHWWAHTCWVPQGTYRAILKFESPQKDVPGSHRVPVAPITYTIPTPFEVVH